MLARELGLAALSLGHHQPSLTVRVAVAAAATALAALTALIATRGRAAAIIDLIRQREAAPGPPHVRRMP